MTPNRITIALALSAVSLLSLAACSSTEGTGSTTSSNAAAVTDITYLTSFSTFGRDSYAYVADEKGYFDDADVNVTITPGSGSTEVIKLVASGQADFGVADLNALAISLSAGDLPVTAVAAIHQNSTSGLMTKKSVGIESAADLPGRSFADTPGSVNQLLFPIWAEESGIDPDSVEFVSSAPPGLSQLLAAGTVDAIGALAVGQPLVQASLNDDTAVFLPYSDELGDLYGNALVVNTDFLEKNPEASAAFVDALLKGLDYSMDNPEESGTILTAAQPTQKADVAAKEVELMKDYVFTEDGTVGTFDKARLDATIATLEAAGVIAAGSVTTDELVDPEFTGDED